MIAILKKCIAVSFVVAFLFASSVLYLSRNELENITSNVMNFNGAVASARYYQETIDHLNQIIVSFTAVTLDLDEHERVHFLNETDKHFAEFRNSIDDILENGGQTLSDGKRERLTEALTSINFSWEEIRDQFDTGMEEAAKTFHFLQITDEVKLARELLLEMEAQAMRRAELTTERTFDRVRSSSSLLIQAVFGVGVLCVAGLLAIGGFAIATRKANARLHDTLGELKQRDIALVQQNERFDAALTNMSQGLCMFDDDERLIVSNGRFAEIFGLPGELVTPGARLETLSKLAPKSTLPTIGDKSDLVHELRRLTESRTPSSCVLDRADGRAIEIWYRPMRDRGWVSTFEDITERRRNEERIAHMARHDALTGLGNRVMFHDKLKNELDDLGGDRKLGILCLDLDLFKIVNDTLGHPVGDALLRAVAGRLKECAGPDDTVVRLGGDEFAIIVDASARPDLSTELAGRIVESVSAAYEIQGHQINIGVSIGAAIAPENGRDADRLLKSADLALYAAKADGRGTVRLFDPEMDAKVQSRRTLELQLRQAMLKEEFEVYYQPMFCVETGRVRGFEALLRWNNPHSGLVSPDEFLPIAEELGMIVPLSEWILNQACREASTWPKSIRIAVNLSALHFRQGDPARTIAEVLERTQLEPDRLELEITEGALLVDTRRTTRILAELKGLGVRIAMDDFGTGYSSLSYLQKFPFDKIKIDRSFIRDLDSNAGSQAIVRAVVGLADSLGVTATAEGVETDEQLMKIRSHGCDEAQGLLFGRPVPALELRKTIDDHEVAVGPDRRQIMLP